MYARLSASVCMCLPLKRRPMRHSHSTRLVYKYIWVKIPRFVYITVLGQSITHKSVEHNLLFKVEKQQLFKLHENKLFGGPRHCKIVLSSVQWPNKHLNSIYYLFWFWYAHLYTKHLFDWTVVFMCLYDYYTILFCGLLVRLSALVKQLTLHTMTICNFLSDFQSP